MIERSAGELLDLMANGATTAEAITQSFLQSIRQRDGRIHAFLHVDEELALTQARAVDAKRRRGEPLGPLAGLPVAVKDVICTAGVPTTCGSKMLRNFVPPYDAAVITKLKRADAVILGKLNCDEFAMGSSTENSAYQVTRNPWNLERVPGGSSGGSASAIAAQQCLGTLGTDTGGSIRQPAACCGIVGIKPTYGRVSRYGVIAYASSLDQVGPMAKTVAGCAHMLRAIAGHDTHDSTSVNRPVPDYAAQLGGSVKGLRLGIPREYFVEGMQPEVEQAVRAAIRVFEDL